LYSSTNLATRFDSRNNEIYTNGTALDELIIILRQCYLFYVGCVYIYIRVVFFVFDFLFWR